MFRSKIDGWLAAVLVLGVFVALAAAGHLLVAGGGLTATFSLVLLGAVLPLWVLLGTYYAINDTELRIASGPFRWRIPLSEINSITPTRNPLSSPALSLDRLRIEYASGKWIMVSPLDKEKFLRELGARGVTI